MSLTDFLQHTFQKQAAEADHQAQMAHKEIDRLKREHESELRTLNHLLMESQLPSMPKYDSNELPNEGDQHWREEFEELHKEDDGGLSKLVEPTSWFSGYDRCNI